MAVIETTTGRAAESGHWYNRDGKPVYEIRGSNGQMRTVTLRDARKFGWVPGFSSIAAMEYKPMLERWKIEQALMAALTLPRFPDETDDAFIARAREDSQEQARKAADRGTRIHAALQGSFEGASVETEFEPFIKAIRGYLDQRFGAQVWRAEDTFAHELGFGGKADLRSDSVILDFKCKDFGEDKTPFMLAFPEHCMQLAAYAKGFGLQRCAYVNVFVSTRVPGLIRTREWDDAEAESAWEAFQCLLKLWQLRRNYVSAFVRGSRAA